MEFLDEKTFNAAFGERLFWVREKMMRLSRPALGMRIGCTAHQLKRYETRATAAFPLHLLPALIHHTFEPYAFWIGEVPSQYWARRTNEVLVDFRAAQGGKRSKGANPKR